MPYNKNTASHIRFTGTRELPVPTSKSDFSSERLLQGIAEKQQEPASDFKEDLRRSHFSIATSTASSYISEHVSQFQPKHVERVKHSGSDTSSSIVIGGSGKLEQSSYQVAYQPKPVEVRRPILPPPPALGTGHNAQRRMPMCISVTTQDYRPIQARPPAPVLPRDSTIALSAGGALGPASTETQRQYIVHDLKGTTTSDDFLPHQVLRRPTIQGADHHSNVADIASQAKFQGISEMRSQFVPRPTVHTAAVGSDTASHFSLGHERNGLQFSTEYRSSYRDYKSREIMEAQPVINDDDQGNLAYI
eukprot:gnl/Dysnectes_brevis/8279_a14590_216.p1 GENE.gnl/Dysnectes_brevis/8279_a14590_216~~gnl/Dysnectes_brevis/8279_a14590_216.p1  ORF type:complete len:305 (+),score=81.58 gnl/Dysnectes_brevis/8279_a14590_216:47-961(+)